MRLRGPHLIGQANLNTSVSSQSGTLGALSIVVLNLNAYAFNVACEIEVPGSVNPRLVMPSLVPLSPDADAPQWVFGNNDSTAQDYAAEWRHINP